MFVVIFIIIFSRLNGVRRPWIKHRRGLQQGDPLLPYLFIIAVDTLWHILQKVKEEGLLTPLRDRMARLRLSLYDDDTTVFVNLTKSDVDKVMHIMHRFSDATSLRINVNKSSVAPIRCSELNLGEVQHNFAGMQVQLSTTYLGLPLCLRLRMVHLQPLFDRAAKRLAVARASS
jgi:hypothetical protein